MKDVSEEAADKMPEGFRNTIRWNLGHIYVVQENLVAGCAGDTPQVPPNYVELFAPGTKPADWQGEIPKLSSLEALLEEQPTKLKDRFASRLAEKVENPFKRGNMELSTIEEILNFTLYHEGLHTGFIKGLKRAVGL
jgi:uncharacterized damage-inducible protein DinB